VRMRTEILNQRVAADQRRRAAAEEVRAPAGGGD